ncbi:MAG: DegT/DnrJ/EryC1/StrS family aminotransferase [Parabacteroides sp.]|nr:DegT/DnrJ/EryC1/StrS family aminotransferase [Parabacteroides sp.]
MNRETIQMVDLHRQYLRLKPELDEATQQVLDSCAFINGPQVKSFATHLASYLQVPYVIPCGNGTDALQIALMALELHPGDEVILPAFTYVAAAEVIALLGLTPVLVDVDAKTFNIDVNKIEAAISEKTKAIIAVHLFGQSCDMEPIMALAEAHHLFVVEDNAQSIGADYQFSDGRVLKTGTIGHIGTTSFFPSKPLACYGDGGALMTSDEELASRIRMIANHGQERKYYHKLIGCNSRLDTLQAAILEVKLKHLNQFAEERQKVAAYYDEALKDCSQLVTPMKAAYSTHVYHQYTIQLKNGRRDSVQASLKEQGIPSMIYYPLPIHHQEAYKEIVCISGSLEESIRLSNEVLSLPIHTEMTREQQEYIINTLLNIVS